MWQLMRLYQLLHSLRSLFLIDDEIRHQKPNWDQVQIGERSEISFTGGLLRENKTDHSQGSARSQGALEYRSSPCILCFIYSSAPVII